MDDDWCEITRCGQFVMRVITPRQAAELAISSRDGVTIAAIIQPTDGRPTHICGFLSVANLHEYIAITNPIEVTYTTDAQRFLDSAREHDRALH